MDEKKNLSIDDIPSENKRARDGALTRSQTSSLPVKKPEPESPKKEKKIKKKEPSSPGKKVAVTMRTARIGKDASMGTFLASLDESIPESVSDPQALMYKKNFRSMKNTLCARLFKLYNSEIFGNGLAENMTITWSTKMYRSAGHCYLRKITRGSTVTRQARVELATRVLDRPCRLRDTLAHELCHAACWVIDGAKGHGAEWLSWTRRVTQRFPEIPELTIGHDYDIVTKYTYRCKTCGQSVKRHSKSLNMMLKRCGICYGSFELFINKME